MTSASRLLGVALAASLCFAAATASAEPSAAEKETARKLVKSGRAKRQAGDAKAALEDFKAAHAIMGVPTTGLELGRAQLELGLLVEARDTLLEVARSVPAPRESPLFAKSRGEAKELAKEIEPKIPQLTLELANAPEGVRVLVDDAEVPSAALSAPLFLNPGKHVIVARAGEREKRAEVSVERGQSRTLTLDLSGLAASPKKKASPSTAQKPSGSTWVYAGFGVAGAGALVGSVTGLMALSKSSSVKEQCVDGRCPPPAHDDLDSARRFGTVSTLAFVVAGVGAGVGVYALLASGEDSSPERRASRPQRLEAWVGPGSAGARGSF